MMLVTKIAKRAQALDYIYLVKIGLGLGLLFGGRMNRHDTGSKLFFIIEVSAGWLSNKTTSNSNVICYSTPTDWVLPPCRHMFEAWWKYCTTSPLDTNSSYNRQLITTVCSLPTDCPDVTGHRSEAGDKHHSPYGLWIISQKVIDFI